MASVATLTPTTVLSTPNSFQKSRVSKDLRLPPKVTSKPKEASECPLFLRKTYHMIDTCDPAIATWSDDGKTFVVKDTEKFEQQIIPQFFKHSKFSSFVRQLNFYGFRKIKYTDTIKIDRKLEAETANYWRFRHEKFQRGHEELLAEIKRSNSQSQAETKPVAAAAEKPEDVKSLKIEVTSLKERVASMSKNIDDLTQLVQNMAVKEEEEEHESNKRKKVDDADAIMSDYRYSEAGCLSDDINFTPGTIFPAEPSERQTSGSTTLSDDAFVDELFSTFAEKDGIDMSVDDPIVLEPQSTISSDLNKSNAPDPKLMSKLSEALTLLPREVQEMLVNRMVATITGTESIRLVPDAVPSSGPSTPTVEAPVAVPASPSPVPSAPESAPQPEIALPLAAATLGALLSHFANAKNKGFITKPLPVIPAHA